MNTDMGTFDAIPPEPERAFQRISVGEVVLVKGEQCEVVSFERRTVTLKLLSQDERLGRGNRQQRRSEERRLRKEARRRS